MEIVHGQKELTMLSSTMSSVKVKNPTTSAEELQKQLVENNVVLRENVPSQTSISRVLKQHLGQEGRSVEEKPWE